MKLLYNIPSEIARVNLPKATLPVAVVLSEIVSLVTAKLVGMGIICLLYTSRCV